MASSCKHMMMWHIHTRRQHTNNTVFQACMSQHICPAILEPGGSGLNLASASSPAILEQSWRTLGPFLGHVDLGLILQELLPINDYNRTKPCHFIVLIYHFIIICFVVSSLPNSFFACNHELFTMSCFSGGKFFGASTSVNTGHCFCHFFRHLIHLHLRHERNLHW